MGDWRSFTKVKPRTGYRTLGSRLAEHRPPPRMREAQAQAGAREAELEAKIRQISAEANAKGAAGPSAEAPATSAAPVAEKAAVPAAVADSYEPTSQPSSLIDPPASNSSPSKIALGEAQKLVSSLELQIDRGSALENIRANRGLSKAEKRARRKKAKQEVVGELLSGYEKTLKQSGSLTGEQLAGHLVTRSIHKRRENWYRDQADRNWFHNEIVRYGFYEENERDHVAKRSLDEAADRRAQERAAEARRAADDAFRRDMDRREMDRRLNDDRYWRDR